MACVIQQMRDIPKLPAIKQTELRDNNESSWSVRHEGSQIVRYVNGALVMSVIIPMLAIFGTTGLLGIEL